MLGWRSSTTRRGPRTECPRTPAGNSGWPSQDGQCRQRRLSTAADRRDSRQSPVFSGAVPGPAGPGVVEGLDPGRVLGRGRDLIEVGRAARLRRSEAAGIAAAERLSLVPDIAVVDELRAGAELLVDQAERIALDAVEAHVGQTLPVIDGVGDPAPVR